MAKRGGATRKRRKASRRPPSPFTFPSRDPAGPRAPSRLMERIIMQDARFRQERELRGGEVADRVGIPVLSGPPPGRSGQFKLSPLALEEHLRRVPLDAAGVTMTDRVADLARQTPPSTSPDRRSVTA